MVSATPVPARSRWCGLPAGRTGGRSGSGLRCSAGRRTLGGRVSVAPEPVHVAAERLGQQGRAPPPARGASRARGRTPAAAITSAMPTAAVTTLRQSRLGSGARIHGNGQPAARNAYRAAPMASTHQPTVGATYRLSVRIRNASTSPSSAAPNRDSVWVSRATRPSTKSRHSAAVASATSSRHRRVTGERVRGQRRHVDHERRSDHGHPVGRAQPLRAARGRDCARAACTGRPHRPGRPPIQRRPPRPSQASAVSMSSWTTGTTARPT